MASAKEVPQEVFSTPPFKHYVRILVWANSLLAVGLVCGILAVAISPIAAAAAAVPFVMGAWLLELLVRGEG